MLILVENVVQCNFITLPVLVFVTYFGTISVLRHYNTTLLS